MDEVRARDTGRFALGIGVAAIGSAVCLATYSIVGGPFGTINDIGNAATAVLGAGLAWRLRRYLSGRARDLALATATVGAVVAVAGSSLVVSGATGWFLAGLVSTIGFGGIGTWLVVINRGTDTTIAWPERLRQLGIFAGALMVVGVAALPAIVLRLDDPDAAPAWAWLGFTGWLGIFVAYPAWAVWLAAVETRRTRRGPAAREPLGSKESKEARSWTGG